MNSFSPGLSYYFLSFIIDMLKIRGNSSFSHRYLSIYCFSIYLPIYLPIYLAILLSFSIYILLYIYSIDYASFTPFLYLYHILFVRKNNLPKFFRTNNFNFGKSWRTIVIRIIPKSSLSPSTQKNN